MTDYVNQHLLRRRAENPNNMIVPRIRCTDGLVLSVQASWAHYSTPRNDTGPWTHVEVGFPSDTVPELIEYADDQSEHPHTVYSFVPVTLVNEIIEAHGGPKEDKQ